MASQRYSVEELEAALKAGKPYLLKMEEAIQESTDGIVSFDVRIYKGKVQDVIIKRVERFTF